MNTVTVAQIKDTAERAAWTFGEAFAAAFVIPPVAGFGSIATWKVATLSGVAAGLAAVKGMLKNSKPTPAVQLAQLHEMAAADEQ